MRPFRRAMVTVALAASATASPVSAAPVCRLVTDARGDQRLFVSGTGPYVTSDVDIVSGDVAIDAKHVVVVVRLASLAPWVSTGPVPRFYEVRFSVDGEPGYAFGAYVGNRVGSWLRVPGFTFLRPAVTLDLRLREVRISMPTEIFDEPSWARGRVIGDVVVAAGVYAGAATPDVVVAPANLPGAVYGAGWHADTATTSRTYRGGTPTCVLMPG